MKRLAVLLPTVALSLAMAPVASADPPDPVQIDAQKPFGPFPGTFSATGAITNSGTLQPVNGHFSAVPAPDFGVTHLTQEFVGDGGTLTIRSQIKETATDDPNVLTDKGHWVILNGTGTYEGLHGQGTVTGTANDNTGVITRTYTGKVH